MGHISLYQQQNNHSIFTPIERYLPFALPLLLLFSRAIADVTVLLVGLIFLFRSYRLNDWHWTKQTWFRLSIIFWLYLLIINVPLSINVIDSLAYAIVYMRWPLFAAALAYWLFANTDRQRYLLLSLLAFSLFIIIDTSLQYLIGQDLFGHLKASPTRLTGPYTRPIPGIMLLRVLFITLFASLFFAKLSNSFYRLGFILSILCFGIMVIFITGERMALILFLTGSLVISAGLLLSIKVHKSYLLGALISIIGGFILLILLSPTTAERSIYSIPTKLFNFAHSDYGVVFRAALAAWQHHFIFGSGIHTYTTTCEQLGVLTELGKQWGMRCSHPHNLYLQIAAETGLIGLILFSLSIVSIYYQAIHRLIKSKQWLTVSFSFTILSVCFWPLIGGISILNNSVAALVWFGVGWVLSIPQSPMINNKIKQPFKIS